MDEVNIWRLIPPGSIMTLNGPPSLVYPSGGRLWVMDLLVRDPKDLELPPSEDDACS